MGESRLKCPRCGNGPNSAERVLLHCTAVDKQKRDDFVSSMGDMIPLFDALSDEAKVDKILAPDTPLAWDITL